MMDDYNHEQQPLVADGLDKDGERDEKAPPRRGFLWRLLSHLTLGNLFTLFLVWEILSGVISWVIPGEKGTMVHHPPLAQHFVLEPFGYNLKSFSSENGPDGSRSHVVPGYFQKDIVTMRQATKMLSTPRTTKDKSMVSEFDDLSLQEEVIVINLKPGSNPQNEIAFIRDAVTFLVGMVRDAHGGKALEVVILLESAGGLVSAYGLLADQLRRLRSEPGITLTVSCDQTALSGGYMMASLATPGHLLAAPFASIGSIGAVSKEILNFREALERFGIKPVQFHGGTWKAPVTWSGDITDDEMEHMQKHIDSFHDAFRDHVRQWRGDAIHDYDLATNGAYWLGIKAHELGLVDRLTTSDEYIDEKVTQGARVLKLGKFKTKDKKKGIWGLLQSLASPEMEEESVLSGSMIEYSSKSVLVEVLKQVQNGVDALVAFVE